MAARITAGGAGGAREWGRTGHTGGRETARGCCSRGEVLPSLYPADVLHGRIVRRLSSKPPQNFLRSP